MIRRERALLILKCRERADVVNAALLVKRRHRFSSNYLGHLFGPVMVLWFAVIAVSGALQIAEAPRVLAALNPAHAVDISVAAPAAGFIVLGAVALAITGGEALYADMGHFGRFPIRLAWTHLGLISKTW